LLKYYCRLLAAVLTSCFRAAPPMLLPSHSAPLTPAEHETAASICRWIEGLIEDRDAYIARHGLDPAVNNPAANWSLDNSFYDGSRALLTRRYEELNMLRVFSQMFSGVFLGVKFVKGMLVPRSVPQDLDATVAAWLGTGFHKWRHKHAALVQTVPELRRLTVPRVFGESGLLVDGAVVSHDTLAYLERAALLLNSGLVDRLRAQRRPVVLEIGSGYGALAHFVRQLVPHCVYICVDLPESLVFSSIYLSRLHPGALLFSEQTQAQELASHDLVFVPNYMFHALVDGGASVDLAINTLSMAEMTPAQIDAYCAGLKVMLGDSGVFFEQNHDNRHIGLSYAAEVIARHFCHAREIAPAFKASQGRPTAWAAAEAAMEGVCGRRTRRGGRHEHARIAGRPCRQEPQLRPGAAGGHIPPPHRPAGPGA
jgi:hypothetical protein